MAPSWVISLGVFRLHKLPVGDVGRSFVQENHAVEALGLHTAQPSVVGRIPVRIHRWNGPQGCSIAVC